MLWRSYAFVVLWELHLSLLKHVTCVKSPVQSFSHSDSAGRPALHGQYSHWSAWCHYAEAGRESKNDHLFVFQCGSTVCRLNRFVSETHFTSCWEVKPACKQQTNWAKSMCGLQHYMLGYWYGAVLIPTCIGVLSCRLMPWYLTILLTYSQCWGRLRTASTPPRRPQLTLASAHDKLRSCLTSRTHESGNCTSVTRLTTYYLRNKVHAWFTTTQLTPVFEIA